MTKDTGIIVALIGNPNSGKSTIFNSLTGASQHVGNYPGITLEKKEGSKYYKGYNITFVDLPGTYSLSAYSDDEIVARDFLLKDKFDIIVDVVNAINLERHLYLFTQITELGMPVIIVLNMADVLESEGKIVDTKTMSELLGVPVLTTVASKEIGISSILDCTVNLFEIQNLKNQIRARTDYGDVIKEEIDKLNSLISKNLELPSWFSIRLLENDPFALKLVSKSDNGNIVLEQLRKSSDHIKEHFGKNVETEMVDRRYGFANSVVKTVIKKNGKKRIDITEIIDSFVINKYLGIPTFAFVMYVIFKFTFTFSEPVVNIFGLFFTWFGCFVTRFLPSGAVQSLIVDGIIGGIGGVLGFFPLILFMFFAIAFFEDSGYMARAAFVMDRIMSKFGLNGKSFLPLMLSTNGCAVPDILATRTLDSKRDRLITMFVVPFMICGAKLPIFALIIGAFFSGKYQTSLMFFMYVLSIAIALSVAKLLSAKVLKGESAHFVMELPPYHLPALKGLLLKMWERSWMYVRKAGTLIVFTSILIWVMFAYPKSPINENLNKNEQSALQVEYSVAGKIGQLLEPLFKPIGMERSKAVALISGFVAKEIIVSTFGTIYSIGDDSENTRSLKEKIANSRDWSPLKGITFLIFCLIYTPCIASVVVFFKEAGSNYKWLVMLIVGNTAFAWIASFIVFQLGTLLKIGM
ncbi:MAG: ferrous iron transport protein B [Endomicrobium sp.]|jgi:ferrous iron transport protein B|nr:ferrous iron transport protein B [Endomicrobium sp.]